MASQPRPALAPAARVGGLGTTIFAEMTALAERTGAINLGQGFPDEDGPTELREIAARALREGPNQYTPARGIPELREAVARHRRRFAGLEVDPETEVQVTVGATEGVAACVLALCDPGDEVVMLDPSYDAYGAVVAFAGGTSRPVALRPPDLRVEAEALEAAIGPRTRVLLLNSPHNPTGRVLDREELGLVAEACVRHDLVAVCDEVYEHLVYDGEHVPLATLPGMAERTLSVSSAGKTFALTGWKVGWVTGPAALVAAVASVKQFLTFSGHGPLQRAVAAALDLPDDHFAGLAAGLRERRDRLAEGLRGAGLDVLPADGGYFLTVDLRSIGEHDGAAWCRALPERAGVVAVPSVVFHADAEIGAPLVRFAFCKRADVIDEAAGRLRARAA